MTNGMIDTYCHNFMDSYILGNQELVDFLFDLNKWVSLRAGKRKILLIDHILSLLSIEVRNSFLFKKNVVVYDLKPL